jgi:CRISPR system Cascade subunit CasD
MLLYGPMAAWGEIAVGEIRGVSTRPSRSALIGLISAALGITRNDHKTLRRMSHAYRFAVRVRNQGTLIRDFHTWQTPKPKRGVVHQTRKEELEADDLTTGLSRRDYYCDAVSEVCLWSVDESPPFSLSRIKEAMVRPGFVLYLGRKSCPPSLPVRVEIVRAETVREAFDQAETSRGVSFLGPIRSDAKLHFWDDDPHIGMDARDTFTRRDVPLNRREWQFTERLEHFGRPAEKEEG